MRKSFFCAPVPHQTPKKNFRVCFVHRKTWDGFYAVGAVPGKVLMGRRDGRRRVGKANSRAVGGGEAGDAVKNSALGTAVSVLAGHAVSYGTGDSCCIGIPAGLELLWGVEARALCSVASHSNCSLSKSSAVLAFHFRCPEMESDEALSADGARVVHFMPAMLPIWSLLYVSYN